MLSQAVTNQVGQRENRHERADTLRIRELLMMNPPSFTGSSIIEDPKNFVDELQKVFEIMHVIDAERVKLDAYQLKGVTIIWFDQLKKNQAEGAPLFIFIIHLYLHSPSSSSMGDIPGDTTATNTLTRLDFNSPFYLHPSENAGSTLLPAVIDGTSYRSWRRAVLRALSVKSKTGFINGKIVKPNSADPTFMQWERCDDMVTSWILNSLSPDLRDSLQYVNNAKELWEELEDRYDQTNGCKLYQLQKEINDLVQGNLDVTGYYTKMKKLWEEMNTLDVNSQCTCVCICGGKTRMHKAEQDRRLIHFLMGLNEMYTIVRGNILMMPDLPTMAQTFMSDLPTMAQTFSILSQEERQREMKPLSHMALEFTSLNASVSPQYNAGPKGFNTNYNANYNSSRGGAGRGASSSNTFRGNSSSGNRSTLFCEYCKRTGHTKDRCYKLHGYPANTRNLRGRGSGSAANVHSSEDDRSQCEETPEQGRQMPLNLSKGQYEQLLNLLGTLQVGNGTDCSGNMSSGAANLAGILACYSSITEIGDLSCKCEKLTAGSWIIDSGASHHMTYTRDTLTNLRTLPYPFLITLPNGYKVKVTEIGDGPSLKSPLALGKARNGLYFSVQSVTIVHLLLFLTTARKFQLKVNPKLHHKIHDTEFLWHARLGHVPFVKMRSISTIPLTFSSKQPFICTICPMARQTRMPFPESTTATSSLFELLHIDLWGPYHVPTHDGYHYFLTMVDDYSRSTWTQLLRCKSNAFQTIKAFISLIENQFHTNLKTIRSDNGLEFTSTEATRSFRKKA
ncbi:uncharacterized protein [Solanum tuberosum]|uniref:uncharacterized protein n=1 Tax=Solanum tuberosum TaxID=4113 RepID=UPI00073A455B|nr:PREDICTED: uncharacterized protein LOC107059226 [Solanum tuberosum]